ncbi:MAG: hypothetical protein P8Z37_11890 [Acidobacteriota bacterium]
MDLAKYLKIAVFETLFRNSHGNRSGTPSISKRAQPDLSKGVQDDVVRRMEVSI